MSNYEKGKTGIGVGKRYGSRYINGATGVLNTLGAESEITLVLGHDEMNGPLNYTLQPYSRIVSAFVAVDEAFGAGSNVNVKIGDAGTGLTTPVSLASLGNNDVALTGLSPLKTTADPIDLVVTPSASALTSTTGRAKLVITVKRV